ncbi:MULTISPECIES: immunity 49 family protein [unclassified Crossiella]|uniref:immunity 49 family protein n=1 Tax=unclassified Crossiella TaxID=2620835 RepID=UPI001FFF0C66|nr:MULTISPECIES: immunity 49 family protein [unclassified Crossiella]MCK2245441.1 immunity 49 family protein [Crossiella sp. S99.2]MCK2259093.1 immunity 49 family protein [Crossiella sp. S99.1]
MTSFARHTFPDDGAPYSLEMLATTLERVLAALDRANSFIWNEAVSASIVRAQTRCAVDPQATKFESWEAWVTAMQTTSALFAAATAPDGVTVRIREQQHRLSAAGAGSSAHAGHWVTACYLALICREDERLNALAQVPVSLLRASGAVFDEYIYSWVETLQSFWLARDDMSDKLVAAVDGTSPDPTRLVDSDYLAKILYPPIILFYRYLQRDQEQFTIALADALQWHQEYWTATEARAVSAGGLVAVGPLAVACLARDSGMPIEIESEYLPRALLEHAWADEIDT